MAKFAKHWLVRSGKLRQTRVIRWHGRLNDKFKLEHETKFLLK